MGYLYDHDDVESLGFGINSCDYDGLDYEDRRDRISTDLIKLGLSFSNAFNSPDIIGEKRPPREESLDPNGPKKQPPAPVVDNTFKQVFTVNFDGHHSIRVCMNYRKYAYGTRITLTGVRFYQPNASTNVSLDLATSFNYGACMLGDYQNVNHAINHIKDWFNDHVYDPQWAYIRWQDLIDFTVPYDSSHTYIVRVIAVGSEVREIGITDSSPTNISSTITITKCMSSVNIFDLYTLKDLIQSSSLKIGMQSCYDAIMRGIDLSDPSMLDSMTALSYKHGALNDTIAFIEKYWYSDMDEYDSYSNDNGYRVRVYIDDSAKIRAYAVVHKERIIYYKDNIHISIGSLSVTNKRLTNAVRWIHDPFLAAALGDNNSWTIRDRGASLYESITQQTEWDIYCTSINFNDGIHSLSVVTRNGKILAASLHSLGDKFNVKPFILRINNGNLPILDTLREPAFQDAILNYVMSKTKSLENPISYFKTSAKTVEDFNNTVDGYEFFDYGKEAVCTDEYTLRLYYERNARHISIDAISIIGHDKEVLYCQTFKYGPSRWNVDILQLRTLCWETFIVWCVGNCSRRSIRSFKTLMQAFGSNTWDHLGPRNAAPTMKVTQTSTICQPSNSGLPEQGCDVIGSDGKYKKVRIVTGSHLYIAKVLIETTNRPLFQDVTILGHIITVEELYAKKGCSRRYIDILRNVTFRDFADLFQVITDKVDPVVTNQYHF